MMDSLLFLSIAIVLAAIVGGLIPLLWNWKQSHQHQFISLGAGVLIGATFLYMIPEATHLIGSQVGLGVLIGFLLYYILEKFVMIHACFEGECEFHNLGITAFLGFSVHSLVDGVALGSSFLVPEILPFVFLGLLTHHAPSSFAFSSILKVANYSTQKILTLLVFFSLMIPLGAFLAHTSLLKVNSETLGWVIAFAAGTFLHLATCDILPEIHKQEDTKYHNLLAFLLGLGFMVATYFLTAHTHTHPVH